MYVLKNCVLNNIAYMQVTVFPYTIYGELSCKKSCFRKIALCVNQDESSCLQLQRLFCMN